MQYTQEQRDELLQKTVEIIKQKHLHFIQDVCNYLPIDRATFYNWGFDKSDIIRAALQDEATKLKEGLRTKWYLSDNSSLQIALYKLLATKEELDILTQNHQMLSGVNGEPIQLIIGGEEEDDTENPEAV